MYSPQGVHQSLFKSRETKLQSVSQTNIIDSAQLNGRFSIHWNKNATQILDLPNLVPTRNERDRGLCLRDEPYGNQASNSLLGSRLFLDWKDQQVQKSDPETKILGAGC
eukprot:4739400-Amphidinium_carterae.1